MATNAQNKKAESGSVAEGNIGAGTGTVCFGWKGGIGTSSRVLPKSLGGYTVGVLVQTNFGGVLQIDGVPIGKELNQYYLKDELDQHAYFADTMPRVSEQTVPLSMELI